MILYHATPMINGNQILKEKKIKCFIDRYHKQSRIAEGTTDGYVYLTPNLSLAYYGAIKFDLLQDEDTKYIYVFRLEIEENELEPDYDEIRFISPSSSKTILTYKESLEICDCVRIKKEILLTGSEYMILPSTMNHIEDEDDVSLCRQLSNMKNAKEKDRQFYESEVIQRWKWRKII